MLVFMDQSLAQGRGVEKVSDRAVARQVTAGMV
jgi:hypothetical protein